LSKYLSHLDGGLFTIIHLESQHWRIARGWIGLFNTSLRTLDALHLAIASAGDLTLVTSDQRLLMAADTLGVKVGEIGTL
jgi:predicted nucleic acid-binding protein